jgi:hypothetical protein
LHLNKNQIIINESSTNHRKSSNNHQTPSIKNHKKKSSNILKNPRTSSKNHPNIEHPTGVAASAAACLDPIDFISSMACGHTPPMAEP